MSAAAPFDRLTVNPRSTGGADLALDGETIGALVTQPSGTPLVWLLAAAPTLWRAAVAMRAAHDQLFPLGLPIAVGGKPIDHTHLNTAARLAADGLALAAGPAATADPDGRVRTLAASLNPALLEALARDLRAGRIALADPHTLVEMARQQRAALAQTGML